MWGDPFPGRRCPCPGGWNTATPLRRLLVAQTDCLPYRGLAIRSSLIATCALVDCPLPCRQCAEERQPLAGRFSAARLNNASAPPNHQTAEHAKTRKEVRVLSVSVLFVSLWLMQAMASLPRAASCCWTGYPQDAARHPKLSSGLVVDPFLPSVLGPRSSGPVPRALRSMRKIRITNARKLRPSSLQLPASNWWLHAPCPMRPAPCPMHSAGALRALGGGLSGCVQWALARRARGHRARMS